MDTFWVSHSVWSIVPLPPSDHLKLGFGWGVVEEGSLMGWPGPSGVTIVLEGTFRRSLRIKWYWFQSTGPRWGGGPDGRIVPVLRCIEGSIRNVLPTLELMAVFPTLKCLPIILDNCKGVPPCKFCAEIDVQVSWVRSQSMTNKSIFSHYFLSLSSFIFFFVVLTSVSAIMKNRFRWVEWRCRPGSPRAWTPHSLPL